jgi:hypothetical protein
VTRDRLRDAALTTATLAVAALWTYLLTRYPT